MNGTFNHKNKDCNVYKDTYADLEFIFIDDQEQIFQDILSKHGDVENIPEDVLLTGIYFKQGTRDISPEYKNGHIRAKYIRK